MNRKSYLLSLLFAVTVVLFTTSCSSKLTPLSQSNFNVTPTPLETVGKQIPVTVNGTFPENGFKKMQRLPLLPYLSSATAK